MPRELKKRGRREEQKRKAQEVEDFEPPRKSRKIEQSNDSGTELLEVRGDVGDDYVGFDETPMEDADQMQTPHDQFYGLLDENEQSYYASVNGKLNANDFESPDDQALFIEAVHRETQGKEIKVASSQSCSRYLEKVIILSTPDQLKSLFTAFLENLTYLVQHRFGSHCCEALFLQAAKSVQTDKKTEGDQNTIEGLFIQAVEHLKPNLGFLVTDRFATHAIRVLLLVLSGSSLDQAATRIIASRRKEKIELPESMQIVQEGIRKVPVAFRKAQDSLITSAFSGLDTTYIRALATHPTGNPFLQLVLKLELASVKSKGLTAQTLYHKLFPDEDLETESESAKFIAGLLYDPTGSRLIEILVQNLPGKQFKKLYSNVLKDRMPNLAKNDIASYVAMRVLERQGKDDLIAARDAILPELPALISRSRLDLVKTLFERSKIRGIDSKPLVKAVINAYGNDESDIVPKLFGLDSNTNIQDRETTQSLKVAGKGSLHGSLLVQAMLQDDSSRPAIEDSFLALLQPTLLSIAKTPTTSHALQLALTHDASSTKFRRQMVPKFYGTITDLAQDAAGSHVVDALYKATQGAHFMQEKIAMELAKSESVLRESVYGRTVWRNWNMDLYQRRQGEWRAIAKGTVIDSAQQPEQADDSQPKKSAIQLARERHANNKSKGRGHTVHPDRLAQVAS